MFQQLVTSLFWFVAYHSDQPRRYPAYHGSRGYVFSDHSTRCDDRILAYRNPLQHDRPSPYPYVVSNNNRRSGYSLRLPDPDRSLREQQAGDARETQACDGEAVAAGACDHDGVVAATRRTGSS